MFQFFKHSTVIHYFKTVNELNCQISYFVHFKSTDKTELVMATEAKRIFAQKKMQLETKDTKAERFEIPAKPLNSSEMLVTVVAGAQNAFFF